MSAFNGSSELTGVVRAPLRPVLASISTGGIV